MKKLILSLLIIGAITIGTGAIAFAAEENKLSTITESGSESGLVISETENSNIGQDYKINEGNNYSGWGNQNCLYYGEGSQEQGQRNEDGNGYGFNSENRERGACGRTGSMMGFRK